MRKVKSWILAAILTLCGTAAAQAQVSYVERSWDYDNKVVTETTNTLNEGDYTAINGSDTSDNGWVPLYSGWYVVTGNSAYKVLNVLGDDVRLIIPDGVTLSVTGGVKLEKGYKLTIYGQADDTGRLIASANEYYGAAGIGGGYDGKAGDLTIHGSTIQATGAEGGAGIGTGILGRRTPANVNGGNTVIIYGGNVNATGSSGGAGIGGGSGALVGSTFHLTVFGGNVTATGIDYGAGIGEGGYGTIAGSTVSIYGGNVVATGGNSNDFCGAGIGGGSNGGGGLDVSIYGGNVTAKCGSTDGNEKRAIGPGAHSSNYGTLYIDPGLTVQAGYTDTDTHFTADLRVSACWYRPYANISPCTHQGSTFVISGTTSSDTHLRRCNYCTTTFTEEKHTIVEGKCTVCGVEATACTVTIYLPQKNDDGTYTDGQYYTQSLLMVPGDQLCLPGSPIVIDGMEFDGWLIGTPTNNSYKKAEGENLMAANTPYTITTDVIFTARYQSLDISLADAADNGETLYKYNGQTAHSVTLKGRTLYKDGSWNTLCLPFNLSNFTNTPLEGAIVKSLESASFTDGTLTLNFSDDLTAIEAGKPYIVKWDGGSDIANPVFEGVTISSSTTTDAEGKDATFHGIYSPVSIDSEGDNTMLYMGDDNTLYYPDGEMTIGACRAYFRLADGLIAGEPEGNAVKSFILNFDDGPTNIEEIQNPNSQLSTLNSKLSEWYTLDGRRLSGKPSQKGVYIHDGRKIVIRIE